jgi:single-stranded DNA-binding protein
MFNCVVFSGKVLDSPNLILTQKNEAITIFRLAVWEGRRHVGSIRVNCHNHLAAIAAKHLQQDDWVAVVGLLYLDNYQDDDGTWRNDAELIALDLELVRGDSPVVSE